MAVVALILQELPELPELDPERVEAFAQPYNRILERLQEELPGDGSVVERELVLEAIRLSIRLQKDLGARWFDVLRAGVHERLMELIEAEPLSTDSELKLSIKFLEQSVETLGVFIEWVVRFQDSLAASGNFSEMTGWLDRVLTDEDPDIDAQSIVLARWQLDLLVAVRCLRSTPKDLPLWAKRCSIGRRRVEAMMAPITLSSWRGELVRQKAKSSWKRWDDEELERELAPWPVL